jgi:hypothetical protein
MRTVSFAYAVLAQRGVKAIYTVITADEQGAKRDVVEITVDFDELRDLARKAVSNPKGEVTRHYRAIVAKVQK